MVFFFQSIALFWVFSGGIMLDVCIRFKLGLLNRDAIGHWGNYCRRRKYLRMKQQLLKGML